MSNRSPGIPREPRKWAPIPYDWWGKLVVDEFAFLEARGFGQPEFFFHQRGNAVTFKQARCTVQVAWDPEDTDHLIALLMSPPATGESTFDPSGREFDLDLLLGGCYPGRSHQEGSPRLRAIAPETAWPARPVIENWRHAVGLNRDQITETIHCWAQGLRDRADDLLGPAQLPTGETPSA